MDPFTHGWFFGTLVVLAVIGLATLGYLLSLLLRKRPEAVAPKETNPKARQWAMIAHAGGLAIFFGLPLGNVIVPLIIWWVSRKTHPFAYENGKESLNFQICVTLYAMLAGYLCFFLVGFLLLPLIFLVDILEVFKATLAADRGETYHYPFTIRFIK